MAGNDTAALVVALSAQLTKFEKDMKGAVDIADKRTKEIENKFDGLNKAIGQQLSNFASTASAQLGTLGTLLTAIGPIGLTVAASVGTLALAFNFVSEKVDQFAEKSKRLKEAAETAGLTVTQFRLLSQAGSRVGLESEQTEAFIDRLTISFNELRNGGGELFNQLARIDVGLVRELSSAKSTAEAIDILSRAYSRLNDQAQRNALARAIGGRAGVAGGRLLDSVAGSGGLQALQEQAVAAGKSIDEQLINKVVELRRQIDEVNKRTNNIWGRAFSVEVLDQQKRSAEFWERIALAAERTKQAGENANQAASDNLPQSASEAAGPFGWLKLFLPLIANLQTGTKLPAPKSFSGASGVDEAGFIGSGGNVPTPRGRPGGAPVPAGVDLELMRRWTSLLGDAITPTEQLKLKILELDAAQEKGGISDQVRTRALAAFKQAQDQAALSTRERFGLASEEEIISVRLRDLDTQRAKGYVKSAEEIAAAEKLIAKEAKLAAEAQQVRSSSLPGLTQFRLDAQNLSKQLDQLSTTSLNNLGTALTDITLGTVSASDGFRNLGIQVVRSVTEMIIRMALLVPIAKGLETILSGGSGIGLNFTGIGNLSKFAGGTEFAPGGMAIVGERGPELLNLPRGSQVIPNNVLKQSGGAASAVQMDVTFKIDGAVGKGEIVGMIQQGMAIAAQQGASLANSGVPARVARFRALGV